MNRPFSGKVSVKAFQVGHPVEFTQKGNRYVHSAIFDGFSEKNEGLEAKFVFPRFRDHSLGIFRLPVVKPSNAGYVDFSNVNFSNELFPYKSENRSKWDYDRFYKIFMDRLQW